MEFLAGGAQKPARSKLQKVPRQPDPRLIEKDPKTIPNPPTRSERINLSDANLQFRSLQYFLVPSHSKPSKAGSAPNWVEIFGKQLDKLESCCNTIGKKNGSKTESDRFNSIIQKASLDDLKKLETSLKNIVKLENNEKYTGYLVSVRDEIISKEAQNNLNGSKYLSEALELAKRLLNKSDKTQKKLEKAKEKHKTRIESKRSAFEELKTVKKDIIVLQTTNRHKFSEKEKASKLSVLNNKKTDLEKNIRNCDTDIKAIESNLQKLGENKSTEMDQESDNQIDENGIATESIKEAQSSIAAFEKSVGLVNENQYRFNAENNKNRNSKAKALLDSSVKLYQAQIRLAKLKVEQAMSLTVGIIDSDLDAIIEMKTMLMDTKPPSRNSQQNAAKKLVAKDRTTETLEDKILQAQKNLDDAENEYRKSK